MATSTSAQAMDRFDGLPGFEIEPPELDRHDIELRDVRDGQLAVSYNRVFHGRGYTVAEHRSDRLPLEFLTLFDSGTVRVADLTDEEREWVEAEGDRIAFEEFA